MQSGIASHVPLLPHLPLHPAPFPDTPVPSRPSDGPRCHSLPYQQTPILKPSIQQSIVQALSSHLQSAARALGEEKSQHRSDLSRRSVGRDMTGKEQSTHFAGGMEGFQKQSTFPPSPASLWHLSKLLRHCSVEKFGPAPCPAERANRINPRGDVRVSLTI